MKACVLAGWALAPSLFWLYYALAGVEPAFREAVAGVLLTTGAALHGLALWQLPRLVAAERAVATERLAGRRRGAP